MFRFYSFIILLSAVLLFAALPVRVQILYTDIEPDAVVEAPDGVPFEYYYVDLNNDGKDDIRLAHFVPEPDDHNVEVYSYPDDIVESILCEVAGRRPYAMPEGVAVSPVYSSKQFINTYNGSSNTALFINYGTVPGEPWDTEEDRYLGVMVEIGGEPHYGWIRLNMPADASSFTVKDYAIQLVPDTPIDTGDRGATPVDYPDAPALNADIYSTGRSIVIELPAAGQATVDLYTVLGAHAGEYEISGMRSVIPMHSAVPGAYIAVLRSGRAVKTRLVAVW